MTRAIDRPELCSVDGCSDPIWSRGLCNKHYLRVWRYGSTELPKKVPARVQKTCQTCGSSYSVERRKAESSKFCSRKCAGIATGNRQRLVTAANFFEWAGSKEGCWEWPFSRDKDGYGKCRLNGETKAHRVAYVLTHGPIPPGYFICHRCDNPPCIRPDHLFLDDAQGNAADMASKKRAVHGERHHSSKLTADDARAIRDDRRPSRQIAREYGISKQTVQKIKKRRTWIHA